MITQIDEKYALELSLPEFPELSFRKFQGESDYPNMLAVINAIKEADDIERTDTVETIANGYAHLTNCDPYEDMLFAQVGDEVVGYCRGWWTQEMNGPRLYEYFVFLKPAWRKPGVGDAMADHMEARLAEIAAEHPDYAEKMFQTFSDDTEVWNAELNAARGYKPVRYGFSMERDLSEPIKDMPLPKGFEVRPYREEDLHAIWLADVEAFRDHWGYVEPDEKDVDFADWQGQPNWTPHLWKVAWYGDEVAGMVLNFIREEENEEYGMKRGYTEGISTRRPFRKKGLATYLLTESMKMFKEMGMEHTALSVDSENLSGALKLYQSVGYKETKRHTRYRKPIND